MNITNKHVSFEDFFGAFSEFNELNNFMPGVIYFNAANSSEIMKLYACIDNNFSDLQYDKEFFILLDDEGKHVYSRYMDLISDYDFLTLLNFRRNISEYMLLNAIVTAVALYFGCNLRKDNIRMRQIINNLTFILNLNVRKISDKINGMKITMLKYDSERDRYDAYKLIFLNCPNRISSASIDDFRDSYTFTVPRS